MLKSNRLSAQEVGNRKKMLRIVFGKVGKGQQPCNVKNMFVAFLTKAEFLFDVSGQYEVRKE